jgi:hypothetical protein
MTLQERVARYLDRNLQKEQAEILVLMEEAAIALFSALPDHFVLFGGATLVLFHESPRISKDLDLLARVDRLPTAQELAGALETRLQEVAGALGLGPVVFEPETEGNILYACEPWDRQSKSCSRWTSRGSADQC